MSQTRRQLIQEGNLGLIRASQDFDPEIHGVRFATYAKVWIRSFMHRMIVREPSCFKIPSYTFHFIERGINT